MFIHYPATLSCVGLKRECRADHNSVSVLWRDLLEQHLDINNLRYRAV